MYCDFASNNCGANDVPGVCRPRPEVCIEIFAPVCGCDGQTYSNSCYAASFGVDESIFCEPSPFPPVGQTCGGPDAIECPEFEICDVSANRTCGDDLVGECRGVGAISCSTIFEPVCGCDGVTYPNDCLRTVEGVAFFKDGPC